MADDPTKQDPRKSGDAAPKNDGATKKTSSEVNAADLLNLWGGMASPQPAPPPAPKPAVPLPPKPAIFPSAPKPAILPIPAIPKPQTQIDFDMRPAQPPVQKPEFKPVTSPPLPIKPKPIEPEITKPATPPSAKPQLSSQPRLSPEPPLKPEQRLEPKPKPPPHPQPHSPLKPEPRLEPAPESPPHPQPKPVSKPFPKPAPEKIEPKPKFKEPEAKTPEQPSKVIEGELVSSLPQPEQEPEMLEESESFGDKFSEFLQELNLGPRHIFYGLGCLALAGFLIFGGISSLKNINLKFWESKKTIEQPKKPANEISKEDTGILQTADVGKISSTSLAAIGATGIDAVNILGSEFEGATSFPQYILLFSRMQNAYGADVNELLNKSTDRRSRLKSHLALLKKLEENGSLTLQKIKSELDTINAEYDALHEKQIEQDKIFFEQLKNFNSKNADDTLSDFISTSRKLVTFKARFKALSKIESYYDSGLPRLSARILDIELNEDPLVKGIKVYDVKGSDLNLILPEDGGAQTQSQNTLGTQLGGGLKLIVPPSLTQGTSGRDLIMNPYGK